MQAGKYRARLLVTGELGDRLRSLLSDLHVDGPSPCAGSVEVAGNASDGYVLCSDGRVWDDDVDEVDVPDGVVRMLLRAALDAERSLVHIHAGAVAAGDNTAIIAGTPGSGKSTAITFLVSSGFTYITDERLGVSQDGLEVSGFPKPISLMQGSFSPLAHLDPHLSGHGASNDTTWQIPASSIGLCSSQGSRAASLVIFIAHQDSAPLRTSRVAPLDAAARLLTDSPDVISRGHAGAHAIVSLAASTPCVEIEYGEADDLVAAVHALLDSAPRDSHVEPLVLAGSTPRGRSAPTSLDSMDPGESFAMLEDVSVWIIDGRSLAYRHADGQITELDEMSTVWLQLLDGSCSITDLIDEVASATDTVVAAVRSTAGQVVHWLWAAGVIGPTGNG